MTVTFPSRISRKLTVQFMSCLFWKETKPTREFTNNWFDAQDKCLGHGLTIDIDKSNQPYWTGVYRRLTPWINILGQYLFVFFYHQYTLLFNIIFNSPIILFCCFFFQFYLQIYIFTRLNAFGFCLLCLKDAFPYPSSHCQILLKWPWPKVQ